MRITTTILLATSLGCGGGQSDDELPEGEAEPRAVMSVEDLVARGEAVYSEAGCADCHGAVGAESTLEGAPSLDVFVDRFGFESDEARAGALQWLADDLLHDFSHDYDAAFAGFGQFIIAARIYEDLISGDGHTTIFAHVELAEPMPAWGEVYSDRDIEALMAYLISTYAD